MKNAPRRRPIFNSFGAPKYRSRAAVPTAVAIFPGDSQFPREWAERQGLNVKRFKKLPKGGHFAALDAPEVFAKDLRKALTELA